MEIVAIRVRDLGRAALFAATVAAGSVGPSEAGPPAPLMTSADAVERALSASSWTDVVGSEIDLAESERLEAGTWDNPELSWDREHVFAGGDDAAEDVVAIRQPLDLSGRRGLRVDAADRRVRAAQYRGAADERALRAEVQARFYEVLRHQERVVAVETLLARIDRLADTIAARERAGDVSTYDRKRLLRERADFAADLGVAAAERDLAWARLTALLGDAADAPTGWPRVAGTLLPSPPLAGGAAAAPSEDPRPEILALEAQREAAGLEGEAAERWWIPRFSASAGFKTEQDGSDRANGYVAGLAFELPLWDRERSERAAARARERLYRGRVARLRAETDARTQGLARQVAALVGVAGRFREEAVRSSEDLARIAEDAYGAGEVGILELLDAHRSAMSARLDALDLAARARTASIELERISGGNGR